MGQKRRQKIRLLREQEEILKSKITELEAELDAVQGEQASLLGQIRELEMAENASRFTKTVSKINKDNALEAYLNERTKTTPIMDSFVSSNKEFLVFRNIFRLTPSWKYVSLIVAKSKGEMNYTSKIIQNEIYEEFTYHALRHTHASKLYEAGLNEKFISERMGHKDDRVTRAVYIHLTDQSREEGRDAVNEIYNALDY